MFEGMPRLTSSDECQPSVGSLLRGKVSQLSIEKLCDMPTGCASRQASPSGPSMAGAA